jgi:hypothetical protein
VKALDQNYATIQIHAAQLGNRKLSKAEKVRKEIKFSGDLLLRPLKHETNRVELLRRNPSAEQPASRALATLNSRQSHNDTRSGEEKI